MGGPLGISPCHSGRPDFSLGAPLPGLRQMKYNLQGLIHASDDDEKNRFRMYVPLANKNISPVSNAQRFLQIFRFGTQLSTSALLNRKHCPLRAQPSDSAVSHAGKQQKS